MARQEDENGVVKTENGAEEEGRYGELLRRLMEAVDARTEELSPAQESVYCRLLASVPLLTAAALSLIENYVASGRRYVFLSSLPRTPSCMLG
jgi:hypothetical protein